MLKNSQIILLAALFALSACQYSKTTETAEIYPIQGIEVYEGQDVQALFNANGAPNSIQNLPDGSIVWTYYTNYRPIGGGEMITYNNPSPSAQQTTCTVSITITNNTVTDIISNNC